jgi:membrane protease YdiL (CAAX protease family)
MLIIIVGGAGGQAIGAAVLGSPEPEDSSYQFGELFSFGFTLVALALWVVVKEGRGFSSLGFRGGNPVGKLALGVGVGALMMGAGVLALTVLGQYESGVSEHTNLGSEALVLLLPLAVVFLLQASTEEAVTRGYMLQIGGLQLPGWVAVITTSVIFSVLHVGASPLALLNIALYAVFASFVALGQGSLWLICGIHAGWNYFQGNIFGVPVSGHSEANSLLAFGPAEGASDLLSGGDFGVEASLVGTLVLAIALVVAFVSYRRTEVARVSAGPALAPA